MVRTGLHFRDDTVLILTYPSCGRTSISFQDTTSYNANVYESERQLHFHPSEVYKYALSTSDFPRQHPHHERAVQTLETVDKIMRASISATHAPDMDGGAITGGCEYVRMLLEL